METLVNSSDIELGIDAADWQDAVTKTGEVLVREGRVKEAYVKDMVETVKELGPYIVLCPGLAMPHARGGDNVLKSGISIITLKNPVNFGNKMNDPVKVVVGLAGASDEIHLKLIQRIADVFQDETMVDYLSACTDTDKILEVFNRKEENQ
ncbi:MAG: PTS sugar transporter subunit IIA [Erysipelotrichaceae bacterium]|nr:PTS sugar transporter subunit IIA [Erysipelotrichaceae bacterium]